MTLWDGETIRVEENKTIKAPPVQQQKAISFKYECNPFYNKQKLLWLSD